MAFVTTEPLPVGAQIIPVKSNHPRASFCRFPPALFMAALLPQTVAFVAGATIPTGRETLPMGYFRALLPEDFIPARCVQTIRRFAGGAIPKVKRIPPKRVSSPSARAHTIPVACRPRARLPAGGAIRMVRPHPRRLFVQRASTTMAREPASKWGFVRMGIRTEAMANVFPQAPAAPAFRTEGMENAWSLALVQRATTMGGRALV